MLKLLLWILAALTWASDISAQMLIVDHAPSEPHQSLALPKGAAGFLADDFQVGTANEDWVIDHIRLWAVAEPTATSPQTRGKLFSEVTLYGGIATDAPSTKQIECDCQHLTPLMTRHFEPGGKSFSNPNSSLTVEPEAEGPDIWRIDFDDVHWSVPGGKSIQFGVLGLRRLVASADSPAWSYLASPADTGQHLRVFTRAGKFQSAFSGNDGARLNIQVWGHLLANVSIRRAGEKLIVILRSEPALQASQVSPASLRFGPKGVSPENVHVVDSRHDGQPDLLMSVKMADTGILPGSINACLDGQRLDGAPFEGCDLLPH